MALGSVLFYAVAAGLVLTALGLILSRNVVHAALLMVGHFLLTAIVYVLLNASFLAVVQVAVYAGAIMVLFLFVVMLMGNRSATLDEHLAGHRLLGGGFVAALMALLVLVVREGVPAASPDAGAVSDVPAGFGSAASVADVLFRDYVLALEIVSVLLLVAMIGVVIIARVRADEPDGESEDAADGAAAESGS